MHLRPPEFTNTHLPQSRRACPLPARVARAFVPTGSSTLHRQMALLDVTSRVVRDDVDGVGGPPTGKASVYGYVPAAAARESVTCACANVAPRASFCMVVAANASLQNARLQRLRRDADMTASSENNDGVEVCRSPSLDY